LPTVGGSKSRGQTPTDYIRRWRCRQGSPAARSQPRGGWPLGVASQSRLSGARSVVAAA